MKFKSLSTFTENEAESGGYGGAIANFGDIVFKRTSRFESNIAKGLFAITLRSARRFMHQMSVSVAGTVSYPALLSGCTPGNSTKCD